MRKEIELLKYHADLASDRIDRLRIISEVDSLNQDASFFVAFEAIDASEQR